MKKILSLLLALLTVLPLILACQKPTDKPVETTGAESGGPTETPDPFDPQVPITDYKEREFLFSCPIPNEWGVTSYDRQEENADQVNDAIYKRNRMVESMFNIKIATMGAGFTGYQADEFQKYAISGEDVVDIIAVGFYQSGKPLIMRDYVLPWNDVEYINLDKPWWNKSVSKTLSLFGNYYYLVGDVNWFTMPETTVCYFNKNVAQTYQAIVDEGGRNLYNIVDDGDWTFDKLYGIARRISADNGDGIWDENDTYGSVQNAIRGVTGFVYGANYETVTMTNEGPVLNYGSQKLQSIIDYLYELCILNHVSYTERFDYTQDSKGIPLFFDDRALFYCDILLRAEVFRGYDSDFGIIPYPKYDKEQTNYVGYADQWGLCCALPCTASDTARTGAILETMSALSRKYIVPAYYDKTLMGKIKRDIESEPMLDMIFANVLYDFGICFCTDLRYIVAKYFVEMKSNNLTSWYKKYRKPIETNYMELASHVYEKVNGTVPDWAVVV